MTFQLHRRTLLRAGGLAAAGSAVPRWATAAATPAAATDRREPQGRWLLGDTHVHTDHSSDGSGLRQASGQRLPGNVAVADQVGQAERMGLQWLPLTDHRTYDQHWHPGWRSDRLLLIPGEEANGSPHATVHGHVEQRVDGANPPGSAAFRHIQQSIWDVRGQDASWSTAHPNDGEVREVRPDGSIVVSDNAEALGVHLIEMLNTGDSAVKIRYAEDRWNAGWRTGVTAASDSHFKELWPVAGPGQPSTRVFAAEQTERALLNAMLAGRTTISASGPGPVVTLSADADGDGVFEAMGGDEVAVRPGSRLPLRVRVERAAGLLVQVWAAPGFLAGPVETFRPFLPDQTVPLELPVADGAGWFRVDVVEPTTGRLLAMVSPVFTTTGAPVQPRAGIPVPAPLGLHDDAVAVLSEPEVFAGFPDVAVAPGSDVVVGEVHRDGGTSVVAVRPDGRSVDLAPSSRAARFPRVAAEGRDVWVVWQDERAGQLPRRPSVYLRHSSDGGRSWDAEQLLSSGAGRAEHPTVAIHRGAPVVAWSDNSRTGAFDVLVLDPAVGGAPVAVSAPGKVVSAGTPADSRSSRYPASLFPALAVSEAGDVVVSWGDNRFDPDPLFTGGTDLSPVDDLLANLGSCPGGQCISSGPGTAPDAWEVLVAVRPAGGRAFSAPVRVAEDGTRADRHPDVIFDGQGALVAVWDSKQLRAAGVNVSLRSARSTDGGSTWSAPVEVGHAADAMSERPRLGIDGAGRALAVWQDTRSADWRWSIWGASLGAGGWEPARRLTGDGNATWPALSGRAVVFASDRTSRGQRDRGWSVQRLRLR